MSYGIAEDMISMTHQWHCPVGAS